MTMPPTSIGSISERSVIGAIIKKPDLLADVLDALTPEDFGCPYAARTLRLMRARVAEGRGIDEISLPEAIATMADPLYPSVTELLGWVDGTPSTAALPGWIREVKDQATRRRMDLLGGWLLERGKRGEPIPATLATLAQMVGKLSTLAEGGGPEMLGPLASQAIAALRSPPETSRPISTGIPQLDTILGGGVRRSELTLIGGRPGMGKTALAVQIGDHATVQGLSTLMFSAEMTAREVTLRQLSSWTHISYQLLRRPDRLQEQHWPILEQHAEAMHRVRFAVDGRTSPTLAQIVATCKRHKLAHGLDLVVIDYFQILGFEGSRRDGNDIAAKEAMVTGLRDLSKDLDIAVILLSQLNRELAKRQNKRATKSDLKGCGGLEEAANVILFPYRPSEDEENADPSEAEVGLGKQRAGVCGTVRCSWDGPRMRFTALDDPFGVES